MPNANPHSHNDLSEINLRLDSVEGEIKALKVQVAKVDELLVKKIQSDRDEFAAIRNEFNERFAAIDRRIERLELRFEVFEELLRKALFPNRVAA